MKKSFILFVFFLTASFQLVFADRMNSDQALETLGGLVEEFSEDMPSLSKYADDIVITSVKTSKSLSIDTKYYLIRRLLKLSEKTRVKLIRCEQCLAPQGEISGGKFVIRKGITSEKQLERILGYYKTDSHMKVQFIDTGFRFILNISIYQLGSGIPVWEKEYKTRLFIFSQTGFNLLLGVYQVIPLEGTGNPIAFELFAGERIRSFGRLGIYVMTSQFSKDIPAYYSVGMSLLWDLNQTILPKFSWGVFIIQAKTGFAWFGDLREVTVGGGLNVEFGVYTYLSVQVISGISIGGEQGITLGTSANDAYPLSILVGFGASLW